MSSVVALRNRDSNMELLRIISMFLVLIVHASFLSIGIPGVQEARNDVLPTITRFFLQASSTICVNVFILLSGWYGIRVKASKIYSLLFQVLFFSILIYITLLVYDKETYLSFDKLSTVFLLHSDDYWFVKSYLGLCFFSPFLNLFVERASERQLRVTLVIFYGIQTVYGWLFLYGIQWFEGGYSAVSFVGLYLLARYIRLHENKLLKVRTLNYFYIFVAIVIILTIGAFGITYLGYPISGRLFTYTNPLVVIEAVSFILLFSRIKFHSKLINGIASSCLAVYLLHGNEFILRPLYGKTINEWYRNYDGFCVVGRITLFILFFFISAILIDKIRLYCWGRLMSVLRTKNIKK